MENEQNQHGSQHTQESGQRDQQAPGASQQAEQRGQNAGQQGADPQEYQTGISQQRMPHGDDVEVNESDTQRTGRDEDR